MIIPRNKNILIINPPQLFVDVTQKNYYPDMCPLRLLQISTLLKNNNNRVKFMDLIQNSYDSKNSFWGYKSAGYDGKVRLKVFILGFHPDTLISSPARYFAPDEIWISASLLYNYEIIFKLVTVCRKVYPAAKIVLGGNYPTNFPNHARKCNADQLYIGRLKEAELQEPDYSFASDKTYALFSLCRGCKNNCSFCINNHDDFTSYDVSDVISYVVRLSKEFKPVYFANWDPNILQFKKTLVEFLSRIKIYKNIKLKFEMGLQPNLLDEKTALLMKKANVVRVTIPFETADPGLSKRLNKNYTIISAIKALNIIKKCGLDVSPPHCTFVIGYPEDNIRAILRTFSAIIRMGGRSTPFPITIIPRTVDYNRYRRLLGNKDASEYNGHLWPLIKGRLVPFYRDLLYFLDSKDINEMGQRSECLPVNIKRIFKQEYSGIDKFISRCLKSRSA